MKNPFQKSTMELSPCPVEEVQEAPKKFEKIRRIFTKTGKRNLIIASSVLLIGAAVWLNWSLFSAAEKQGYDGYDNPSTAVELPTNSNAVTVDAKAAFFSATQVSRQRARDEALEVLQSVVDDVDASETNRNAALTEIKTIADEIQREANIETLVTAKGFERCVAVLNGDKASIVVDSAELLPAQVAQIKEIVYTQAGILPTDVTIINK